MPIIVPQPITIDRNVQIVEIFYSFDVHVLPSASRYSTSPHIIDNFIGYLLCSSSCSSPSVIIIFDVLSKLRLYTKIIIRLFRPPSSHRHTLIRAFSQLIRMGKCDTKFSLYRQACLKNRRNLSVNLSR